MGDSHSAQYLASGYTVGVKCARVVRIDGLNGGPDNRDGHRQRGRGAAGIRYVMDQAKKQARKQKREPSSCCRPTASLLTRALRDVL